MTELDPQIMKYFINDKGFTAEEVTKVHYYANTEHLWEGILKLSPLWE